MSQGHLSFVVVQYLWIDSIFLLFSYQVPPFWVKWCWYVTRFYQSDTQPRSELCEGKDCAGGSGLVLGSVVAAFFRGEVLGGAFRNSAISLCLQPLELPNIPLYIPFLRKLARIGSLFATKRPSWPSVGSDNLCRSWLQKCPSSLTAWSLSSRVPHITHDINRGQFHCLLLTPLMFIQRT